MKRQFAVRVTPDEEREIQEMAAKASLSVSEWLRLAVIAAKLYSRNPEALASGLYPEDEVELRRIVSPELLDGGRSRGRRRSRPATA